MNMVSAVVYKLCWCWWTPGGSSGAQQAHIEWLTVVTDASLLIVLWLCLTTLFKVLIITPSPEVLWPCLKERYGEGLSVSQAPSGFEFIIFVLLSPLISSAERFQGLKIFWTSGVWVKSEVVSQKTRIDLLSKHTVTLRNCLTLWAWFLHFKREKVSLGDL